MKQNRTRSWRERFTPIWTILFFDLMVWNGHRYIETFGWFVGLLITNFLTAVCLLIIFHKWRRRRDP